MNFMKNILTLTRFGLLMGMLAFPLACTDNFDEVNTDSSRASLSDPAVAADAANGLFSSALSRGLMEAGEFQRVQALYADLYAQYFATSAKYFASDRYAINQSWLDYGWERFYPRDINNLVTILNSEYATANQKLIAKIWKAFLFHRMVEFYGDIPYFSAGNPDVAEKYDSQREIYYDMFTDIKDASDNLDLSIVNSYSGKDIIYSGETAKWKRFANTLRLRLALRIVNADPEKAELEAKAAIEAGIFTSNSDNALAKVNSTLPNALNQITGWNEFRMSATSESILVGYDDPRLSVFFAVAAGGAGEDTAYTGKFNGIRNGLPSSDLDLAENKNQNNSNVGRQFGRDTMNENPRVVLTYAEACFMMAEAVMKGWATSGTAQEWYEKGITASMNQFGITDATTISGYISSTNVASQPVGLDRGITQLPVVFSGNTAEQLEQIITQKWIATYPDGFQAWAEFRRTGYPKLYTIGSYDPATDVPAGSFVQRVPYTSTMRSLNADGIAEAESRMGGSGQNVKLWFAGGN